MTDTKNDQPEPEPDPGVAAAEAVVDAFQELQAEELQAEELPVEELPVDVAEVPEEHDTRRPADRIGEDEEIERLYTKPEVQDLVEAATAETQDRYLRILAEYDNFRRRTGREKAKWSAEGLSGLLSDLLSVFDSFDRARVVESAQVESLKEGLELTYRQLQAALGKHDIQRIDPVGEKFDPRFHEALTRAPSADHPEGTVMQVFEVGYTIDERLVRPARVVVSSGPAN